MNGSAEINQDELLDTLEQMTSTQFKKFILKLNVPLNLIPSLDKPQTDIALDVLLPTKAPGGCGLQKIKPTLEEMNISLGKLPSASKDPKEIYKIIEFPKEQLREIVKAHDEKANKVKQVDESKKAEQRDEQDIVDRGIKCFLEIREDKSLVKKPGTSEFLDWLEALRNFDGEIVNIAEQLTKDSPIPYQELLFKHSEDWLKEWKVS